MYTVLCDAGEYSFGGNPTHVCLQNYKDLSLEQSVRQILEEDLQKSIAQAEKNLKTWEGKMWLYHFLEKHGVQSGKLPPKRLNVSSRDCKVVEKMIQNHAKLGDVEPGLRLCEEYGQFKTAKELSRELLQNIDLATCYNFLYALQTFNGRA